MTCWRHTAGFTACLDGIVGSANALEAVRVAGEADLAANMSSVRVAWAVPCVSLHVASDGLKNAVGLGITEALVESFPSSVSLWLAIRLIARSEETADPPTMTVLIRDSSGEEVVREEGRIRVGNVSRLIADTEETNSDPDMPLTFDAKRPGRHTIEVQINGEVEASTWIDVVLLGSYPDPAISR